MGNKKCIFIFLSVVLFMVLAGCTEKKEQNLQTTTIGKEYKVNSIEEFLEAIEPNAKITFKTGYYNLTEFLDNYLNEKEDYSVWNENHEYVEIRSVLDGVEIVIKNVDDLYIEGGSENPKDTEIVTEPRYATVLNFENCNDIELQALTIGHTDTGSCSGNVLGFSGTTGINLRKLDLYGCGVYAIECNNSTGNLYVYDSIIRDCELGPFDIYDAAGEFKFTDCTLSESDGGGSFESNEGSKLSFLRCSFGQEESNVWSIIRNDVSFEECEFMEVTEYSETDYNEENIPVFDYENMEEISFDDLMLEGTKWTGYSVVNPQSGDTQYLDRYTGNENQTDNYAYLQFNEDKKGLFKYNGETMDFEWEFLEPKLACLKNDEMMIYISMYQGEESNWIFMQFNNDVIWFY